MTGHRKLIAYLATLGVTLWLALLDKVTDPVATLIIGAVMAFVAGNGAEHFAKRGGANADQSGGSG